MVQSNNKNSTTEKKKPCCTIITRWISDSYDTIDCRFSVWTVEALYDFLLLHFFQARQFVIGSTQEEHGIPTMKHHNQWPSDLICTLSGALLTEFLVRASVQVHSWLLSLINYTFSISCSIFDFIQRIHFKYPHINMSSLLKSRTVFDIVPPPWKANI